MLIFFQVHLGWHKLTSWCNKCVILFWNLALSRLVRQWLRIHVQAVKKLKFWILQYPLHPRSEAITTYSNCETSEPGQASRWVIWWGQPRTKIPNHFVSSKNRRFEAKRLMSVLFYGSKSTDYNHIHLRKRNEYDVTMELEPIVPGLFLGFRFICPPFFLSEVARARTH